jgi:hypothetical protein
MLLAPERPLGWCLNTFLGHHPCLRQKTRLRQNTIMPRAFLSALALVAVPLCAGVRIQMDTTDLDTNKTTHQEILVDNTRLRVNMDADTSVMFLTDGGRDRMVMLDKSKNEYREVDKQTMDQLAQQMQGAMAQLQEQLKNMPPEQRAMVEKMMKGKMPQAAAAAPPVRTVYKATGSGNVNGFACTKYEGTRNGEKTAELCAAQPSQLKFSPADFQVFDKMREFTASLQSAFKNSPFSSATVGNSFTDPGYQGFPVEDVTFANGKPSFKTDLKSAQQASFTDADFSTGNAKKVEMPMPGRGRRPR